MSVKVCAHKLLATPVAKSCKMTLRMVMLMKCFKGYGYTNRKNTSPFVVLIGTSTRLV